MSRRIPQNSDLKASNLHPSKPNFSLKNLFKLDGTGALLLIRKTPFWRTQKLLILPH